MARFITVLDPDSPASFWTAVQWADSLDALRANHYYNAGVNLNIPKGDHEIIDDNVSITEINTMQQSNATIIELSQTNANFVKLASTKASKRFLRTLLKIGGNNVR